MEQIEDSIKSLQGRTVAEKLKNLNKLVLQIRNSDQATAAINRVIDSLVPQNDFEKLVKLRLIDSFEYAPGVINVIKSGDLFYIPWVLKYKWFFSDKHELLQDMKNYFVNVLPFMSYTVRIKFIKKYATHLKNSSKAESFYNILKRKYGIQIALLLLPACSEPFIRNLMFFSDIIVSAEACFILFDFYPDLVIQYMKYVYKHKFGTCEGNDRGKKWTSIDIYTYENVLRKYASTNVTSFIKFYEEFHKNMTSFKFGRHVSKRIIKTSPESILQYSDDYLNILSFKHVTKMMSIKQIETLHFNIIPKSLQEFKKSIDYYQIPKHFEIIKNLKPRYRQEILNKSIQTAYGKTLFDVCENISIVNVTCLPQECREKWAESKIKTDFNNETKYVAYLPTKKAISKIKTMIKTEKDIYARAHLVQCMFESVQINKDFDEIYGICDYVVQKHRNDNIALRGNVLRELRNFDLSNLTTASWDPIIELINIFCRNDELDSFRSDIIHILSMWVHHRLLNNLPTEEQLTWILNLIVNGYDFSIAKNTIFEKQCLLWFIENIKKKTFVSDNARRSLVLELFIAIMKWNISHTQDVVSFPEWILSEIEAVMVADNYHYWKSNILNELRKDKIVRNIIFDRIFPNYIDHRMLSYKLHENPGMILENLEIVMKELLKHKLCDYKAFLKNVKLLSGSGLPEKIVATCLEEMKRNSNNSKKGNSVFILSLLMPAEDFIKFITPYFPTKSRANDYTDEGRETYQIQKSITENLKNICIPSITFVPLKNFTVGDYLQLVLGSLDSIFLRTQENLALDILKGWLDCPVSLRKHLVRSYCKIASIELASNLLMQLFETETNPSLRMVYFNQVFKIFKSEPNEESWSAMLITLNKLTADDKSILDTLYVPDAIPQEFYPKFIEALWEVIHKIDLSENLKTFHEIQIIQRMIDMRVIKVLSECFCDNLISLLYSNKNYSYQKCLNEFAKLYLLYSTTQDIQSHRLKKVQNAIGHLVKSQWSNINLDGGDDVCQARILLESLLESVANESCIGKNFAIDPSSLITELRTYMLSLLEETDIFSPLLLLKISLIFYESKQIGEGQHFEHFFTCVGKEIDNYCSLYGGEVMDICVDVTNTVLNWFHDLSSTEKGLRVCEIFVKNSSSKYCHNVGIKVLPVFSVADFTKHSEDLINLLNILKNISTPSVKIFLNSYYKSLDCNDGRRY